MKLKLLLIICIYSLISNPSFGQFLLEGKVIDHNSNEGIEGVNIAIQDSNEGTITDGNGMFLVKLKETPSILIFSHVKYENDTIDIVSEIGGIQNFYLKPQVRLLDEFVIYSIEESQALSEIEKYSIKDFEIVKDKIYSLDYHGSFKKYVLTASDIEGNAKQSLKLNQLKPIEQFHKSCDGILYLLSGDGAYPINNDNEQLALGSKVPKTTFEQFILPCKLKNGNKLYYINEEFNGLKQIISTYRIKEKTNRVIRVIANEELIYAYKEDQALMGQGGNSIRINNIETNRAMRNREHEAVFLKKILYKPEFPLYITKQNGKVVLLNHIEGKIELYQNNWLLHEIDITYMEDKQWLKSILIDEKTEKIYGIFKLKKGIGIKEINIESGQTKLVSIIDVALQNLKTIRIFDGHVFYLKKNVPNGIFTGLFYQGIM